MTTPEPVRLTEEERGRIARCVWGAGEKTRSPLLPLLVEEVERIVAARVAAAKAEALSDAAAWLAKAFGYPVDCGSSVPMPEALWEALVDHVYADQTGEWHSNTLDREDTEAWLAEEAGRDLGVADV